VSEAGILGRNSPANSSEVHSTELFSSMGRSHHLAAVRGDAAGYVPRQPHDIGWRNEFFPRLAID
jgi:hypothetical protein